MRISISIALLSLGHVASATWKAKDAPKCWKSCAKDVGIKCLPTDTSCFCRAAVNGYFTSLNSCACSTCGRESIVVDTSNIQLKDLAIACANTWYPISGGLLDRMMDDASCLYENSKPSQDDDPPDYYEYPLLAALFPTSKKTSSRTTSYTPSPSPTQDLYKYETENIWSTLWVTTEAYVPTPTKHVKDEKITYSYATVTMAVTPVPLEESTDSTRLVSTQEDTTSQSESSKKAKQTSKNAAEAVYGPMDAGWMGAVVLGLWGFLV